jgi:RNA polymerase sigma-70 factor (ECF subfamily)
MGKMAAISNFEENVPSLRRYIRSLLLNIADANELVQDCIVRALDRMNTQRTEGDLRPWLFTIMHNILVNRWRRMTNSARLFSARGEVDVAVAASQEVRVQFEEVVHGLDAHLDGQRETLLLVAVEGLQYDEVAKMLDVPVGSVMSRWNRVTGTDWDLSCRAASGRCCGEQNDDQ